MKYLNKSKYFNLKCQIFFCFFFTKKGKKHCSYNKNGAFFPKAVQK